MEPNFQNNKRPIIGITMGDPVGVGPEIILLGLKDPAVFRHCRPLVLGDLKWLQNAQTGTGTRLNLNDVNSPNKGVYRHGWIDVLNLSTLNPESVLWGKPTPKTAHAMVRYIIKAIDLIHQKKINAMVTGPINKSAMKAAGYSYQGHTEIIAEKTNSPDIVMMFTGDRLNVALVTIHVPFKQVPALLTTSRILKTIMITDHAMKTRFGINAARIAVAGLNPHAGESGLFGEEEEKVILPAVNEAAHRGVKVFGPLPPDTVYYQAISGKFDAVISMYHDQGLIPFKMLHFTDGVNTTVGTPIIRTSVDHGTAYDIAGSGKVDPGSLLAAIRCAVIQVKNTGMNTHAF